MKKVLRSLLWTDQKEQNQARENFGAVRKDRLKNLSKEEEAILSFEVDFYATHGAAPSGKVVYDHFQNQNLVEESTVVEEAIAEAFYDGADFIETFEAEVESQAVESLAQVCKKAMTIARDGITIKGTKIKGVDAAVACLFSEAEMKPGTGESKVPANMTKADVEIENLYFERKNNPLTTYGVRTGYGIIDASTAGIRRKSLYIHAGFNGHLKSTQMLNMMLNATVSGWNPILFTSEMPADDVKLMLVALHSADPKFNGVARPISAHRLLLGALTPQEEDFFKEVKRDLLHNPDHGVLRVVDSSEFTTFGSIMQRTVKEHSELEVDIMWVDYITRLPVDTKYQRMQIVEARNETIAEAKRFAMGFDNGAGLAVCTPFQVNREGYKAAKSNSGKYSLTALGQYNAAEKEADVISYIWYDEEERATNEPKCGMLKSRYGHVLSDPVSMFIEPDSRRIFDLTAGMTTPGGAPTSAAAAEEEVVL